MDENIAPESDSAIEQRLAERFEAQQKNAKAVMDEEEAAPVQAADDAEEAPDDAVEATEEVEASAEEVSDDAEEVEYEGKAYKLPKELKAALLRQSDYTKKTQEVAETRRFLEAQQQKLEIESKFQEKHADKVTEYHALNRQLQQFANIDWAKLADENPAQYLVLDRQQRTLQDAANRTQTELQHLGQQFQQEITQAKQKAQAQCVEELKRTFKEFGPELVKSLDETGKSYGFSGEELASLVDPRQIRVLHDAMQYRKLQSSKTLVDKKVATAKPVQLATSRSVQSKQANSQLGELKARALKSGKGSDVESFLAARFAKSMR